MFGFSVIAPDFQWPQHECVITKLTESSELCPLEGMIVTVGELMGRGSGEVGGYGVGAAALWCN